jgi:hypothetical protein
MAKELPASPGKGYPSSLLPAVQVGILLLSGTWFWGLNLHLLP